MEIYRGDTFKFEFSATLEDGTVHTFQAGDTLKAGLKYNYKSTEYQVYQEKNIAEDTETVMFEFSHEEMMQLTPGEEVLEVELTDTSGVVSTLYQEQITVVGDIINE